MQDNITIAITENAALRVYTAVTTNTVNDAQKLHNSYPVATAALGRSLTGAAIMGAMLKNENGSITLHFKGDGPLGTVLTVTDADSNVRGYTANPDVDLPIREDGKIDVGGGVGKEGILTVIRDEGVGEPYNGQVELISGEIAEDIVYYYAVSEQIPTAMALGVLVNPDLSVKAAGGYCIQLMPGYGEDDNLIISKIEEKLKTLPSVTQMIENGMTSDDMLASILGDIEYNILDHRTPSYQCNCSRQRVERALVSIGANDLKSLIESPEVTEVDCSFCDKKYRFTKENLEMLLDKCTGTNSN